MGDWDAQRSILRPAMIETFVQQRISDFEMWYSRIPQYLRSGTNPIEKTRFLEEICEIVDRFDLETLLSAKPASSKSAEPSRLTLTEDTAKPAPEAVACKPKTYAKADVASVALPNRDRFHDPEYTPILKAMVAHVVATEGPIIEDLLIDRIARAHHL